MQEKRKYLTEILTKLNFPLTREELVEKIKNLSDQEVDDLINIYSDLSNFSNAVTETINLADPNSSEKIYKEYETKKKKVYQKYLADLKRVQAEMEDDFDKNNQKYLSEIDVLDKEIEENIDKVLDTQEKLNNKLGSVIPQE